MPAGSKMDLPLAKAEPISDGGNASGITYLRRGQKKETTSGATPAEERSENMREQQLCRHQAEEGSDRVALGWPPGVQPWSTHHSSTYIYPQTFNNIAVENPPETMLWTNYRLIAKTLMITTYLETELIK
ncbi:hypothetical protein llap_10088 [Limosa lapponica baueri]|uniref:Uncharacterized protein n=1 Tax=Limosa lapponica baueri TaxID=1758121 RepID=A0A2I0U0M4_LIMLA|nr:hypothetical protein llap_10088 [Limosa lapponica baueri]